MPAKIYKYNLYGTRKEKLAFLETQTLSSVNWTELPENNDIWVLEGDGKSEYQKGFSVAEMFGVNGVGIVTAHDDFVIDNDKNKLLNKFQTFQNSPRNEDYLHQEFKVNKKNGWNILEGFDNIKSKSNLDEFIQPISYRPFDTKYIFYEDRLVWRSVGKVMQHFIKGENIGLVFARTQRNPEFNAIFISKNITETKLGEASTQSAVAPLYLYTPEGEKIPNLNSEIVKKFQEILGGNSFSPENILDYIYAFLHSPSYRLKYQEFLKKDFPKVPFPESKIEFDRLANLGFKLRELHLMTDPEIENFATTFPIAKEIDNNLVERIKFETPNIGNVDPLEQTPNIGNVDPLEQTPNIGNVDPLEGVKGKVFINDTQYFGNVSQIAWNFYIGGYQPAQKWLKDRKNSPLSFDDIMHYQKIIKVLEETQKLMLKII